jgi:hypothetical protein
MFGNKPVYFHDPGVVAGYKQVAKVASIPYLVTQYGLYGYAMFGIAAVMHKIPGIGRAINIG